MIVRHVPPGHGTGRARTTRRAARFVFTAVALAGAALVSPDAPASAQSATTSRRPQASADSARLAADPFFRAVADERWDAAATMVDTVAVRRIVHERLRWRTSARREMTLEDFMRGDPNKPHEVAEYELKRYREQTAKFDVDPITYEFVGVKSADELELLSALDATSRYLQAQDLRVIMRELMRRSGCPAAPMNSSRTLHRMLGVVLASDTVAYVLHEDGLSRSIDPSGGVDPMVMQLRLRPDGWRILPTRTLLRRQNFNVGGVSCDTTRGRRPPG